MHFLSQLLTVFGLILIGSTLASAQDAKRSCSALPPKPDFGIAGETGKYWDRKELKVRFLDGDPDVQKNVQRWANVWTEVCGLKFNFGDHAVAEIRISFKEAGSWSYIGTDSLIYPQDQKTMNLGWLTPTTADDEYSRVVLHEFGHAIGFIHEHQSPAAGIKWDKPVVEAYYAKYDGWSAPKVKEQIFDQYSATTTNYTAFDNKSIMCYPILPGWTTNGVVADWNRTLSDTDKSFASKIYKDRGRTPRRVAIDANGGRDNPYLNSNLTNNDNQQFSLERQGDYVRIIPKVKRVALDANGGNDGTKPYFNSDLATNDNHLYKLEKVGNQYMIIPKVKRTALDANGGSGNPYFHASPNPQNPNHLWELQSIPVIDHATVSQPFPFGAFPGLNLPRVSAQFYRIVSAVSVLQ